MVADEVPVPDLFEGQVAVAVVALHQRHPEPAGREEAGPRRRRRPGGEERGHDPAQRPDEGPSKFRPPLGSLARPPGQGGVEHPSVDGHRQPRHERHAAPAGQGPGRAPVVEGVADVTPGEAAERHPAPARLHQHPQRGQDGGGGVAAPAEPSGHRPGQHPPRREEQHEGHDRHEAEVARPLDQQSEEGDAGRAAVERRRPGPGAAPRPQQRRQRHQRQRPHVEGREGGRQQQP